MYRIALDCHVAVDSEWYIRSEIREWLKAHGVKFKEDYHCDLSMYPDTGYAKSVDFYFNDPNNALMFKLTWGGNHEKP